MIERISDNAHEITHRGHIYTIIHRSAFFGAMYDLYIDGHGPCEFYHIADIARKYPHLGYDLALI